MIDKLLRALGFEAGLAVIVYGVWGLGGRAIAMLVLGSFLILCSVLSQGGALDVRTPLATFAGWMAEHLTNDPTTISLDLDAEEVEGPR